MSGEPGDRIIREPPRVTRLSCASGPGGGGGNGPRGRERGAPLQVFTEEALSRLGDYDEPPTALEAELGGLWRVVRLANGYGVVQWGDEVAGDPPLGRFNARYLALLAAAALPGLGRACGFKVGSEAGEEGYPLRAEGVEVGALRVFLADLGPALDLLATLLRSPVSLALLLEAAGPTALKRAGRVLGQRLVRARED